MKDVEAQWRHDCRTPIHQILGYSELLVEEAELQENGSLVRDLRRIRSAALVLLEQVSGRSGARRTMGSAEASFSPTVARRPGSGDPESAFESSEARGSISGRVLVVDDDRENCELLIRRLEKEGLEVEAVMEGVAALRKADWTSSFSMSLCLGWMGARC